MTTNYEPSAGSPAFIFDLDGTLIDSVYQHVVAWRRALHQVGIELPVWKLHRRIGMSGGLMVTALLRELDRTLEPELLDELPELHAQAFEAQLDSVQPLPGAAALMHELTDNDVPWVIATSGAERIARQALERLDIDAEGRLVTRDQVRFAKPDPDLFLAGADRLGVDIRRAFVVGDAVWDMLAARRAGALGVGLLSGGYGREELLFSGAFRVYDDPADLLAHLDEVGVRRPVERVT
jgi:HAD superfamily hydrolase (TIGR01549 family)